MTAYTLPQGQARKGEVACWEIAFDNLFDRDWQRQFWYKPTASMRAAQKLGYKFCRVKITEIRSKI